uniref:lysozyme n=1 Tax=Cacopsylla melanoneura TaxID=428564 RepID=A0A8D8ZPG7_9HEMI
MSPLSLTILLTVLMTCTLLPHQIESKTFGACELAQYLAGKSEIKKQDIPTWVCIATKESDRNSNAVSPVDPDGSKDHGIFQINDRYWCTTSGPAGKGCNAQCSAFEDDDISDDVSCVANILAQTAQLTGNGFKAWSTYQSCDSPDKVNPYVEGCSYVSLMMGKSDLLSDLDQISEKV